MALRTRSLHNTFTDDWQLTLKEIISDVGAVDVTSDVECDGKQSKETGDE